MELKPYQKRVLSDLAEYLDYVCKYGREDRAFDDYWTDRVGPYNPDNDEGMRPYESNVPGTPNVCIKVPTAGGKTFIACNALKVIFDCYADSRTQAVVWLVPSTTILEQTIKHLSNPTHPYRQRINTHFRGKVEIYTKDQLLQGAGFNPTAVTEQLSIFILSFDTLRSRKKEDRKIYQENGQLASFNQIAEGDSTTLEGIDETALINVIRKLEPVVIVDESHNASSELSLEMLANLNPSFILDLTATPRKNSNIISFVNPFELKRESMVKLPVIVHNHHDKTEVINNALQLQNKLEAFAKKELENGGKYIRPIILFQAEPKNASDSTTFEKLKKKLIEMGLPEEQIKIKTAKINELKGIDLTSKDCPVRYIITVNALKEGWDCPFAYILASLANRNSNIDVEQILGRILRQPYVQKHSEPLLNLSYVLTGSADFMNTLQKIVEGLNKAGFSEKDYVLPPDDTAISGSDLFSNTNFSSDNTTTYVPEADISQPERPIENKEITLLDDFDEIDSEMISNSLKNSFQEESKGVETIVKTAIEQNSKFEEKSQIREVKDRPFNTSQFTDNTIKVAENRVQEKYIPYLEKIELPQFFIRLEQDLGVFSSIGGDDYVKLSPEQLLKGFELSKADSKINFENIVNDIYEVDLEEKGDGQYSTKFMKVDPENHRRIIDLVLSLPHEERRRDITSRLMVIGKELKEISDSELEKYLDRITKEFDDEQITDYFNREYTYKYKIKSKIRELFSEQGKKKFSEYLDSNKINIKHIYRLPQLQHPGRIKDHGIIKALYSKEHDMNNFELKVINDIANLKNVLFWTRNPDRNKGFCLNGFINHYPDFIVVTQNLKIILIETKGDDRDNSDSLNKLKLGRAWANKAGENYKYFMVFNNTKIDGAYQLNEILNIIKEL